MNWYSEWWDIFTLLDYIFLFFIWKTSYQEQDSNLADLCLLRSIKWYKNQGPSTLYFNVPQQATQIGYGTAEVANKMKLADYKGKISPPQCFTKQTKERFLACLFSPFFHTKNILTQLHWLFLIQIVLLFLY